MRSWENKYVTGSYEYAVNEYELPETFELESKNSERFGSYKLSAANINRMLNSKIKVTVNNETMIVNNITNSELIVLIHLTHICSSSGYINELNYNELVESTKLCLKSIYNAMNGLKLKEYITITKKDHGLYDVCILRNKYENSKDDKQTYVNTNRKEFLSVNDDEYEKFIKLTLQEKKLLLLFLLRYDLKMGYSKKISSIIDELNIKNYSRLHKYILNLKSFIGEDELLILNKQSRIKNRIVKIKHRAYSMLPDDKVIKNQATYFRRQLKRFIRANNVSLATLSIFKENQFLDSFLEILMEFSHLGIYNVYRFICYILQREESIHAADFIKLRHTLSAVKTN